MTRVLQVRSEDVVWRQLGDEIVVLDLKRSDYLRLNGSGALLWQRLVEPTAEDELHELLVRTYGIDRQRAAGDVSAFVEHLAERRLLVTS